MEGCAGWRLYELASGAHRGLELREQFRAAVRGLVVCVDVERRELESSSEDPQGLHMIAFVVEDLRARKGRSECRVSTCPGPTCQHAQHQAADDASQYLRELTRVLEPGGFKRHGLLKCLSCVAGARARARPSTACDHGRALQDAELIDLEVPAPCQRTSIRASSGHTAAHTGVSLLLVVAHYCSATQLLWAHRRGATQIRKTNRRPLLRRRACASAHTGVSARWHARAHDARVRLSLARVNTKNPWTQSHAHASNTRAACSSR